MDRSPQPRARYAKLPAGAHGLAPELVRADQDARLQAAIVELVAERGYAGVSVADVLARAAISRRTFYEHYANKQACFAAAYGAIVGRWTATAAAAHDAADSWRASLRNALTALFEQVVADPLAAHAVFIESLRTGGAALERRGEAIAGFEKLARRSLERAPGGSQTPPAIVKILVGGVREVIASRLRTTQTAELPTYVDPLVRWMLSYRSKVASEILKRAGRQRPGRKRPAALPQPGGDDPSDLVFEPGGLRLWLDDSERPVVWHPPRERILAAVTEIAAEKGYDALSVAEIARAARTNHQTFNKLFDSKEEAFLAAYDDGGQQTVTVAADAYHRASSWPAAVHEGLAAQTRFLASHPAIARIGFLELYAGGPGAVERRDASLQAFKDGLEPGYGYHRRGTPPHPIAAEAIGGGIFELMRDVVVRRGPEELPAVVPVATYAALAPFLGAKAAAVEAARPLND